MDRVKRLSLEVLEKYRTEFGEDFADNKKTLDGVSIIRSKGLKNEIAGYITKTIKSEIREAKAREAQERARLQEEEDAKRIALEAVARGAASKTEGTPLAPDGDADVAAAADTVAAFDDSGNGAQAVPESLGAVSEVVDQKEGGNGAALGAEHVESQLGGSAIAGHAADGGDGGDTGVGASQGDRSPAVATATTGATVAVAATTDAAAAGPTTTVTAATSDTMPSDDTGGSAGNADEHDVAGEGSAGAGADDGTASSQAGSS